MNMVVVTLGCIIGTAISMDPPEAASLCLCITVPFFVPMILYTIITIGLSSCNDKTNNLLLPQRPSPWGAMQTPIRLGKIILSILLFFAIWFLILSLVSCSSICARARVCVYTPDYFQIHIFFDGM